MSGDRIYGQFCPVSMGAEIFANKWTPLVLRELMCGSTRFGELHKGVPLMSRSLLAQRLRELEHVGLVEAQPQPSGRGADYHLTEAGEALRPVVMALGAWAHRYLQREIPTYNLDPGLLMWDVRRNVDAAKVPPATRTQFQFELAGVRAEHRLWWLLVHGGEVELCLKWPGHDNDLEIAGHVADITSIWLGHLPLSRALGSGKLRLTGTKKQRDAFRKWFRLSAFGRGVEVSVALPD